MYNVQKSGREALVHMPKKIAELREKMIAYARQALLQEGTSALTVRSTASACGVAVGTVYNYFPSKESLIEAVILADWEVMLAGLREQLKPIEDALEDLRIICDELQTFATTYGDVLSIPPTRLNANEAFYRRHGVFVEQLCGLIQPVILRCDCLYHPVLPEFLAEALLVLAADPEKHFENVRPIFARLL